MTSDEKRRDTRYDSLNLLDYTVLDQNGKPVDQGMGRTLNVSRNGILLEVLKLMDVANIMQIHIGIQENMVTIIRGQIVHSEQTDNGRYSAGVHFLNIDRRGQQILDKYIELFEAAKKKL
ncbi:MAG: PilZ domain-containing protein [Candidatus Pacebacteria bacterium]|nr:PilZ domain-containing protein [Candidatus Paceibacterota bacterium]